MKNQLLKMCLTALTCAVFLTTSLTINAQTEAVPLTKFIGQIFEQGYGGAGDEEGIDLMQYNEGTAMCGWSYAEEDEYTPVEFGTTPNYSNFNLEATYWLMDKIGEQQWEVRIPIGSSTDDIATGICAADVENEAYSFASCVRHTTVYNPNSVVEIDDELSVWLLSASGAYSLLYQHQRDEETFAGIAPIDIKLISGGYLVLANAIDYSGATSVVLLRIGNNGLLTDYKTYTNEEGGKYLTYEMEIDNQNRAVFAINELMSYTSAIGGYTINGSNTFLSAFQGDFIRLFGIDEQYMGDNTGDADLLVAGYEFTNYPDTNAIIVRFDAGHNLINMYVQGLSDGTEMFRDISTHDLGFQAIGLRNNEGEGMRSVYISHMGNTGNEYFKEMMGSQYNDQVTSLMLRNDAPLTSFAGRHTGWGINETGNAYLGGVLLQQPQYNCVLPRFMWIGEFLTVTKNNAANTNSNTVITSQSILGNAAKEQDLIDFCVENNIDFIHPYGTNNLFSNNLTATDKSSFRTHLEQFNIDAKNAGITIGIANEFNLLDYQTASQVSQFNFSTSGKINYVVCSNEFWNYEFIPPPDNTNPPNTQYQDNFDLHVSNLVSLKNIINTDANGWELHTYIARFFNGNFSDFEEQDFTKLRSMALAIENEVDFIHVYSGVRFRFGSNPILATNFLNVDGNTTLDAHPVQLANPGNFIADGQRNTLSLLGSNPAKKTYVAPIFYTAKFTGSNDPNNCPEGSAQPPTRDFLGKWFEQNNPTNNSGNTMTEAEKRYLNQYNLIYDHIVVNNNNSIPASSLSGGFALPMPDFDNLNLNAMSWHLGNCIPRFNRSGAQFSNKNLNTCQVFSSVSISEIPINSGTVGASMFQVFPNPANVQVHLEQIDGSVYTIKSIVVYNILGQKISLTAINESNSEIIYDVSNLKAGLYLIQIEANEGHVEQHKLQIK